MSIKETDGIISSALVCASWNWVQSYYLIVHVGTRRAFHGFACAYKHGLAGVMQRGCLNWSAEDSRTARLDFLRSHVYLSVAVAFSSLEKSVRITWDRFGSTFLRGSTSCTDLTDLVRAPESFAGNLERVDEL